MTRLKTESHADALLQQLDLPYDCSEVGNMERFIAQHKDRVRFIPERNSWAKWSGRRWEPCVA